MTSLTRLSGKSPRQAPTSGPRRERLPGQAWRIDISVEPDWFNLATHCVDLDPRRPERRRWSDALRRLPREDVQDAACALRGEREDGLIGGSFFYSLFHDGLTGRNHLWSHERRGFVSSWAVAGPLFPAGSASVWEIRNRYCLLPSATRMAMRLDVVGGRLELAVGCAVHGGGQPGGAASEPSRAGEPNGRERVLARFPLEETLRFFLQARRESGDVMRRVKRFTPDLSERLEAEGFDYAAWPVQSGHAACDEQGLDFFGAPRSFRKTRLPPDQEDDSFSPDRVMSHGFLSHYLSVVMRLEFHGP